MLLTHEYRLEGVGGGSDLYLCYSCPAVEVDSIQLRPRMAATTLVPLIQENTRNKNIVSIDTPAWTKDLGLDVWYTSSYIGYCSLAGNVTGFGIIQPPVSLTATCLGSDGRSAFLWRMRDGSATQQFLVYGVNKSLAIYDDDVLLSDGRVPDVDHPVHKIVRSRSDGDARAVSLPLATKRRLLNGDIWAVEPQELSAGKFSKRSSFASSQTKLSKFELGDSEVVPDSYWRLYSYRNQVPTNIGTIRIGAFRQDDLFNVPYLGGVAPNWLAWSDPSENGILFEEGRKALGLDSVAAEPFPVHPDQKAFYQLLRANQSGAIGGVLREFVNLDAGHQYRVSVRVNTLNMDSQQSDWRFDVGVTCGPETQVEPDYLLGSEGSSSILYSFKNGTTTDNRWVVLETVGASDKGRRIDDFRGPKLKTNGEPGDIVTYQTPIWPGHLKDIQVNGNNTRITVWLRHSANAPTTGVGMDWLQLEDLGPTDGQSEPGAE